MAYGDFLLNGGGSVACWHRGAQRETANKRLSAPALSVTAARQLTKTPRRSALSRPVLHRSSARIAPSAGDLRTHLLGGRQAALRDSI